MIKLNPESLDLSIQSALSALFPPFEATAPIVLSQLFRTIDERYHGDALQCLLDFLIPSKHLLESVQQAACAGYSDVVFRCEGWPLCLHDKTVIQLAPVNPLLLRPGDFYLQVEPFGDQAARIVLKSLLEEGCREVEETPIPETSYPCMFTEEWLQDINEGRHGTPLSRCLLCTDQGVIKLPWANIAIPEFLDKPKIMATCREAPPEPKQISLPFHFNSSTLPVEAMIFPAKDRMSASLRPADCSSKLIKMEHGRRTPKSCSKPLIKPVGWVSPNTCDSHNYQEIEGDYVDLVDIAKGKEFVGTERNSHPNPPNSVLFKPVRPPPPVPLGNNVPCGRTLQFRDDPCTPCSQRKLRQELTDQDLKCRYRDSYLAALRNPVAFERGSADVLAALEEVGLCEEGELKSKSKFEAQRDQLGNFCHHCKEPMIGNEPSQYKHCCEPTPENLVSHLPTSSEENLMKESPVILKSTPGLSHSHRVQTKVLSQKLGHTACVHPVADASLATCGDTKSQQKGEDLKPSGKHKIKVRSLSTVSETPTGSPLLYKLNNRSHSDICPGTVASIIQCKKGELFNQETLKLETEKCTKKGKQSLQVQAKHSSATLKFFIQFPCSRDRTGRAVVEVHGDRKEWMSPLVSAQNLCELLLYLHSIPRKDVRELGMTLVINARKKPPPLHLYKALLMAQEQALHAVHSIVMLMDKDTCPRPERQPGLQMDMVTSTKALNKTMEASQLTSDLGGTFTYSHTDWLQFHQKLVSFMTDLQGADSLLQKAIKKIDGRKHLDTAEDVQQCIQEQRVSMKEVLEDTRLVTLQREGGALLARMKREEFRFPQSEDYRDSLESVTSLYNQVEEKLHTLVMRSNESLQHLEFLFRLREMETLQRFHLFLTQSKVLPQDNKNNHLKMRTHILIWLFLLVIAFCLTPYHLSQEKQQHAMTLVAEAEGIVSSSDFSPATNIFQTLVSTFKSNVEDFKLQVEQRYKELDTLVHVYSFCEQVCVLQWLHVCFHSSGISNLRLIWSQGVTRKLQKIMEELLSTEREYVKALGYVREHYFPELERNDVPQDLRGQRGSIFGNLEKLHDFHRHHFLNELEGCVNEPFRVGRCFLRHRESFALYALYSKNKPQSDSLLINHGQAFFKQKQLKLGDKMDLWSYLLKPVQRISKYSLLLQDMMRECGPGQIREITEVKAALEVIHFQLRHGNNLLAMDAIHHCDVNLKEQGQLIRQDEFLVTLRKKKCFRHIFLFQELILFSKTKKTDVGNDTYIYKQSFKTSDVGLTQNSGDSGLCFEIWFRKRKSQDTYTLQAVSREVKEAWTKDLERILWEQAIHNREVRMQERVFLGIGNKPFMDIQPSEAAINDRAINYVLIGRGGRPKSVGSGSTSSSSSSSGRGSLSPVGYLCGPKRRVSAGVLGGYVSPSGALEEDDLDHESGSQNLLCK
uniref:Quattro n=1 Tax=Amphiprion ocellaris TaxID=80972 RepID=A0A3Q1B2A9_AMPOC